MEGSIGLLKCIKPPTFSAEHEKAVEEWEQREAEKKHRERVELTMVPPKYQNADITECIHEVQRYTRDFTKHTSKGLILRGDPGRGKTHAACAILNALLDEHYSKFATMGDILDAIQSSFRGLSSIEDVLGRYVNVKLLVIDDLGKDTPSDAKVDRIFKVLDHRYRRGKPTIITTQYTGPRLAERLAKNGDFEGAEAIVSRLQESMVIDMPGPDRRCS